MYCRKATIINPSGLHAKPASVFVREAKKYNAQIVIANLELPDTIPVNAKSVMPLLSLGIGPGCKVELAADGEDEVQAVDDLIALIESGLGETPLCSETAEDKRETDD